MKELTATEAAEVTGGFWGSFSGWGSSSGLGVHLLVGGAVGFFAGGPWGAVAGATFSGVSYLYKHDMELYHLF